MSDFERFVRTGRSATVADLGHEVGRLVTRRRELWRLVADTECEDIDDAQLAPCWKLTYSPGEQCDPCQAAAAALHERQMINQELRQTIARLATRYQADRRKYAG